MNCKHEEKARRAVEIAKRVDLAKQNGEPIKVLCHVIGTSSITANKYWKIYKKEGEKALFESVVEAYSKNSRASQKNKKNFSSAEKSEIRESLRMSLFNEFMGFNPAAKTSSGVIWVNG